MALPLERKNLTVQEAADILNVRRERVWKLMHDGVLSAQPSKLDGRQKLIPREQVEKLLLEEGYRPRRTVRRARKAAPALESESAEGAPAPEGPSSESKSRRQEVSRPYPNSIGVVSSGNIRSSSHAEFGCEHRSVDLDTARRLPRTIGAVEDESFQASESEAYMHEHRDRDHSTAE